MTLIDPFKDFKFNRYSNKSHFIRFYLKNQETMLQSLNSKLCNFFIKIKQGLCNFFYKNKAGLHGISWKAVKFEKAGRIRLTYIRLRDWAIKNGTGPEQKYAINKKSTVFTQSSWYSSNYSYPIPIRELLILTKFHWK